MIAGLLLLAMLLILLHASLAPQLFNQALAINTFGTLTILLMIVVGVLSGRDYFIDIALLYALVNFVGMIALLRLFNKKGRSWPAWFKKPPKRHVDD